MTLETIVYISVARPGISGDDVNSILASARRFNVDCGITGVLLQYAGHFVQVLEGGANSLRDVMARIVGDTRHAQCTVLAQRPLEDRRFGGWSMQSVAVAQGAEPAVDDFFRKLLGEHTDADVTRLVDLLEALARRH